MNVIELTNRTFSKIVAQNALVVVDFWAEWCEPCKSFAKVIEQLAPKYSDVVFGSVDIDREQDLATDFAIRSVPTILILKQQVVVYADSGALTESVLTELIDQAKALDISKLTP
ncbi:MAG: hypothetical protein A3F10_03380 [Coxiella sp. RIFCSPHIGHO2_12_FULL_42_15]|nr:MAG: hypothetical protein A3F10_03380 [Coxiella sp. RIFCSPHIGHO2_12_FULL_42_15]